MSAESDGTAAREASRRRRRAAELLGDLLPESTRDDLPDAGEDRTSGSPRDAELLRDVPPHHGG